MPPSRIPWHRYTVYKEPSPWPLVAWAALMHVCFSAASLLGPVVAASAGLRADSEEGEPGWAESLVVLGIGLVLMAVLVSVAWAEESSYDG